MKRLVLCLWLGTLSLGISSSLWAVPIFFGPTPYLSTADIPGGFYAGGVPTALEDFEDSSLDFGITASAGAIIPPGFGGSIDSVDADDGSINGSGLGGHSFFFTPGSTGIIFTFPTSVTAAGIVWTDGAGTTTFEAFSDAAATTSLGTIGPVAIADGVFNGTTAEDRFFGITDLSGIQAIKLSNTVGGIEVDHVQYGNAAIPEPSTWFLFSVGILGIIGMGYRQRKKAA